MGSLRVCSASTGVGRVGPSAGVAAAVIVIGASLAAAQIPRFVPAAPAPPIVFEATSPTAQEAILLSGESVPGARVRVEGGAQTVECDALSDGMFLVNVPLVEDAINVLSVTAVVTDPVVGVRSAATSVVVVHDGDLPGAGPGEPATLAEAGGDGQRCLLGDTLLEPLRVVVRDVAGEPVAGVDVTFTRLMGSGTFDPTGEPQDIQLVTTGVDGTAETSFTLGDDIAGPRIIRASFDGNQNLPFDFQVEGLEPAPVAVTRVSGVVMTEELTGLPGVTVRLLGTGLETLTDEFGGFLITDVVPVDLQLVELDASTATLPGPFSDLEIELVVLEGQDNRPPSPIFLPRLNDGVAIPVDGAGVVQQQVEMSYAMGPDSEPVILTVPAGTTIRIDGEVPIGDPVLSLTPVADNRVPMPLGEGRTTQTYVTIQPRGATFKPPLPISMPNLDGLAPGESATLMSFDHERGEYVEVGTATASEDGTRIVSDPGSGIVQGGWHGTPRGPGEATFCVQTSLCGIVLDDPLDPMVNPLDVLAGCDLAAQDANSIQCECWASEGSMCSVNLAQGTDCVICGLPVAGTTIDPNAGPSALGPGDLVECRCTFDLEVTIDQVLDLGTQIRVSGTVTGTQTVDLTLLFDNLINSTASPVVMPGGLWTVDLPTPPMWNSVDISALAIGDNGTSSVASQVFP